jgi:hypothetical protein
MNKKVILLGLAISLLVSACAAGEPPVPTIDPNSIVNTAQAAAFTMIAETQAAIPTATFTETPTATPVASDTPIPSPTLDATALVVLPTATSGSSANTGDDPCFHAMDTAVVGTHAYIRIKNKTSAPITGILYLYTKNAFNECGYMSVNIPSHDSNTYTPLTGSYIVKVYTKNGFVASPIAIISDDHLIDFEVYDDYIKLIYP